MEPRTAEILQFWFGAAAEDPAAAIERNRVWFGSDPAFDDELRARFGPDWRYACRGELNHWADEPRARLALILLLDQFSRNLCRGTGHAFAQDGEAAALTLGALEQGMQTGLSPSEHGFLLMPLQHAEDLELQQRSVAEFERLHGQVCRAWQALTGSMLAYAREHCDIIRRFGRFPHRNRALGRTTTDAEQAFLAAGASSYGQ